MRVEVYVYQQVVLFHLTITSEHFSMYIVDHYSSLLLPSPDSLILLDA